MSQHKNNLCSVLLKEYFGEVVQAVGTFLMKQPLPCTVQIIAKELSLPSDKVKSCLCILIQHHFCNFTSKARGIVEYKVTQEKVINLLYYERYAYSARNMYGDPSHLLVEEILGNGRLTMSEAIQKVIERLKEAKVNDPTVIEYSSEDICSKFKSLVTSNHFMRCSYPHATENKNVPNLSICTKEKFVIPEVKLYLLGKNASDEQEVKKQKIEFPDSGIYWQINFDKFKEYFRNEDIITACSNVHGEKASEIVKAILMLSDGKQATLAPTTVPVEFCDILKFLGPSFNSKDLEAYLTIFCEEANGFISKANDRANGMYVVNISGTLKKLVEATITSVVQDRFGSKCARIFRILLDKKALEPKQIEELAMIQPKDTKEYIYKLFEENFILSQDVSKGSDSMTGQEIYLLLIDIVQVCRMVLERCYKATFNLLTRCHLEYKSNKRILDKNHRIEAIVASLEENNAEEDHIEEIKSLISDYEKGIIEKVKKVTDKIDCGQIQMAEMIFTLSLWLEYRVAK